MPPAESALAAPAIDRRALADYYRRTRARSRQIFDIASSDAFLTRPIPLRHPIVFYEGHLPGFSFNTLVKKALGGPSLDRRLETLFARGIDPESKAGLLKLLPFQAITYVPNSVLTGKETRLVVLGHLLRGGSPTRFDRLIAQRFGAAAVRAIADDQRGVMVALDPPTVKYVPLEAATKRMKTVPLNSDIMHTAREMGISFGD